MRTTVNIDDHLLGQAKAIASRSHRSVGSVLEDALRRMLADTVQVQERAERVRLPSDGGSGLQPGVDLENKQQIAELLGDEELRASP